jgi:hypothetical protein
MPVMYEGMMKHAKKFHFMLNLRMLHMVFNLHMVFF